MIYLIRSSAFKDKNDKSCNEHEVILKIGYTKDNSRKSRFNIYITENPTIQILYLIPGGTEQDEKNLHNHFKEYLKHGQEWFSEVPEILNFFETHTTKESLQELKIKRSIRNIKAQKEFIKENYIDQVLLWKCREEPKTYIFTEIELEKLLQKDLLKYNDQELDNYFKSTYPKVDFNKDKFSNINVPKNIEDILKTFYNSFNDNFVNQMKFVYEQKNILSDFDFNIFKSFLPAIFINYITILGFDEIRTCGYQRSKIISRLSKKSSTEEDLDNIKSELLSKFKIGEKYSNIYIKDTLKSVYESNGYGKTPKASNLNELFYTKPSKVLNSDGKYENGLEIIKIKEEDN